MNVVKKIIKGILMSVIILIIGTVLSLLVKLFQAFCPVLFGIFVVIILLITGFFYANIFWK